MELLDKSRDELLVLAEKLQLTAPKKIDDTELRMMISTEAIRQTVELEERVRLKLQDESKMKRDIAEIQAEATIRGTAIEIPKEPTLTDIFKLKKELKLSIDEPKPSPETLAIEASKKVYAIFHNREQEDMDVPCNVGGKYWFHLYPERTHILPEWVINHWRKTAAVPIYEKKVVAALEAAKIGQTIEVSQRAGTKQRFLFEILGEAPSDSSFGVVLDSEILNTLKQTA